MARCVATHSLVAFRVEVRQIRIVVFVLSAHLLTLDDALSASIHVHIADLALGCLVQSALIVLLSPLNHFRWRHDNVALLIGIEL